jgi:hypothetical protein
MTWHSFVLLLHFLYKETSVRSCQCQTAKQDIYHHLNHLACFLDGHRRRYNLGLYSITEYVESLLLHLTLFYMSCARTISGILF